MGQFEAFVGVNFWTALFILLNTLIIFFVAKKFLFGPVMKIIADRQKEIDDMYAAGIPPFKMYMTYPAMMLAAEYMDNEATAQAAANTVLEIATKHPEFYSAEVKALLEKVAATVNDGDAVYKRKDIEKFISENKEGAARSIITELSEEEKAEGFELLFNGKDMSAWTGNLDAYQPVNGEMYVTASYGSTGNLYTIALPFTLTNVAGVFGEGTVVYEFAELQLENNDLVLYFDDTKTTIEAGKPYLIVPAQSVNGFEVDDATISATPQPISFTVGNATVTMEPVLTVATNATTNGKYWLASDTYLYNTSTALKSLCAVFDIQSKKSNVRARIAFNENAATGFDNIVAPEGQTIKAIVNGQLVIIRGGEMYNVQGQVIR